MEEIKIELSAGFDRARKVLVTGLVPGQKVPDYRGLYRRGRTLVISGVPCTYQDDPPAVRWVVVLQGDRLKAHRLDWPEGREVVFRVRPGARVKAARIVVGNDPGRAAGPTGEIWELQSTSSWVPTWEKPKRR